MNTGVRIEIESKGFSDKPGGFLRITSIMTAGSLQTAKCEIVLDFDRKTASCDRTLAMDADYVELAGTLRMIAAHVDKVSGFHKTSKVDL